MEKYLYVKVSKRAFRFSEKEWMFRNIYRIIHPCMMHNLDYIIGIDWN